MKRFLALFLAAASFGAFAAGELVATGADIKYVKVDGNGSKPSSLPIVLDNGRTCVPWKISVLNAVKAGTETTETSVVTGYVVRAVSTTTNAVTILTPVTNIVTTTRLIGTNRVSEVSTNIVNRQEIAYRPTTAYTTNIVQTLDGLDTNKWETVDSLSRTDTKTTAADVAAGGTVTLSAEGSTWGPVTISNGTAAETSVLDMSKLAFPSSLRVTATDAEKFTLRVIYLKLAE